MTETYHILVSEIEDNDGKKLEAGTLWKSQGKETESKVLYELAEAGDKKNRIFSCAKFMPNITESTYLLLIAIAKPKQRLQVFIDVSWRKEGEDLKLKDNIQIINHTKPEINGLVGTIRYKGGINHPDKLGTFFGIELHSKGKGACNGYYCGQQLFTCAENTAIFVTIYRIRHLPKKRRNGGDDTPVVLGERVVWLSEEDTAECGTVRWIGTLPDSSDKSITIGVEFDNPVGTGTGKYLGTRLFQTRNGYASLIPPIGLMKYYEYFRSKENGEQDEGACGDEASKVSPRGAFVDDLDSMRTENGDDGQSKGVSKDFGTPSLGKNGAKASGSVGKPVSLTEKEMKATGFKIGDRVQVDLNGKHYGAIQWMGKVNGKDKIIAGLEMDDLNTMCYTNGTFQGVPLFTCLPFAGLFVYINRLTHT